MKSNERKSPSKWKLQQLRRLAKLSRPMFPQASLLIPACSDGRVPSAPLWRNPVCRYGRVPSVPLWHNPEAERNVLHVAAAHWRTRGHGPVRLGSARTCRHPPPGSSWVGAWGANPPGCGSEHGPPVTMRPRASANRHPSPSISHWPSAVPGYPSQSSIRRHPPIKC